MSIRFVLWALDDAPGISSQAAFVLVAMAERADENGLCWPSVADLTRRTRLGERTVRRALAELRAAGHIATEQEPGRLPRYTLRPSPRVAAEAAAPLPDGHHPLPVRQDPPAHQAPPPAQQAGDPCLSGTRTVNEPSLTVREPERGAPRAAAPAAAEPPRPRRRTIPDGWKPDAAGIAYAIERGLAVEPLLEHFRDHHRAKGTLGLDWLAYWRTWCRNEVRFAQRRTWGQDNRRPRHKTASELLAELRAERAASEVNEIPITPSRRVN